MYVVVDKHVAYKDLGRKSLKLSMAGAARHGLAWGSQKLRCVGGHGDVPLLPPHPKSKTAPGNLVGDHE